TSHPPCNNLLLGWFGAGATLRLGFRPAPVQVAQLADLGRVGAVVLRAGDLEVHRELLEGGMCEERADPFAHDAFEHVRMPVAVRPERCRTVVDVECAESVEP